MDWVSLCRVQRMTISMFSVQFGCFGVKMNPCVRKCLSLICVSAVCFFLLRCVFFCVSSYWPFCEGVYFSSLILSPCVQCSQGDNIKLEKYTLSFHKRPAGGNTKENTTDKKGTRSRHTNSKNTLINTKLHFQSKTPKLYKNIQTVVMWTRHNDTQSIVIVPKVTICQYPGP